MILGVTGVTALGLVFIFLSNPEPITSTSHGILGIVVCFVLLPLQLILGFVCNALYSPERLAVPFQDHAHAWIGRSLVVLAVVNITLGILLYNPANATALVVGCWVVFAVLVGGFVGVGEFLLGGAKTHGNIKAGEGNRLVNHE
jgi:hypothetical protein